MLIVAVDARESISQIVEYAQKTYPDLHIIARATDHDHVYDLWCHGCRETADSTLRMGRSAFQARGAEHDIAQSMVDAFNAHDLQAMIALAQVHKIGVAPHNNPEHVANVADMQGDRETALRADLDAIRVGRTPERAGDVGKNGAPATRARRLGQAPAE